MDVVVDEPINLGATRGDPTKKFRVTVEVPGDSPLLEDASAKDVVEIVPGPDEPSNGLVVLESENGSVYLGERQGNGLWTVGFGNAGRWQDLLSKFPVDTWTYHTVG